MYILLKISWIHQHRKNTDEFTRNLDRNSHVLPLLTCRGRIFNVVRYVSRVFIIQIVAKSFNCIINDGRQHDDDLTWFSESKPVIYEKLFLQRYGEQSVRWQLCAPYRCKNKCLLGICFYSDIKHKSNNTTKHAQKVTSVVEFQAQKILAKIIQNNRLL